MPKKSQSQIISQERARALSQAMVAGRILDAKYFDDAAKAVRAGASAKPDFVKICTTAEIPPDLIDKMWAFATTLPSHPKYAW